jgi:hypothetical protein
MKTAAMRMTEAVLGPDELRRLLRECVTVVGPGETLVVRAYDYMTPRQVRELQAAADAMCEYRHLPFSVIVVPGEELGVVEAARGSGESERPAESRVL